MDVVTAIERMGGLATRAALIRATSRAEVDQALRTEAVVRVGQGRVVPRNRNVPKRYRERAVLHSADLAPDDVVEHATSRELTLTQCLRLLPYDQALMIADSALRNGEHATLRRAATLVRGRGQANATRVAATASDLSANAFESVMRAICNDVPGLRVQPQVVIATPHCWARPDLVDRELRIVVECDSYEWHGGRDGFRKDVRRYTLLVAEGWRVLRFTWEDVMFRPDWVREVVVRAVVHAQALVSAWAGVAA